MLGRTQEQGWAAAGGQPGRGILKRPRRGQSKAFVDGAVWGDAKTADRRPGGGVVDDQNAVEAHTGLVDMNDFVGTQVILDFEFERTKRHNDTS